MGQQENLRIAREVFEAWNKHDPERYVKLLDEDHVTESDTIPAPIKGRAAGRDFMKMYVNAFPDLHFSIDQLLESGNFVVTRYTATGTHGGQLMGIAATHKRAQTHGCSVNEIRSGKIVRTWLYWDTGHLLRQLGVMP